MQDITELLKEAKPLYKTRKRNRRILAAGSTLGALCFVVLFSFNMFKSSQTPIYDFWGDEIDIAQYGSVIEDMGLPVDENGLLWII